MPWLSIIIFLVTLFLQSGKKGKVEAKDVAIAAGAGLASYALIDPANSDALWPLGGSPTTDTTTGSPTPSDSDPSPGIGGTLSTITGQTAGVLKSWGPAGTVGVIAGTAAVTGSGVFDSIKPYLPWLLIGGAILLLK